MPQNNQNSLEDYDNRTDIHATIRTHCDCTQALHYVHRRETSTIHQEALQTMNKQLLHFLSHSTLRTISLRLVTVTNNNHTYQFTEDKLVIDGRTLSIVSTKQCSILFNQIISYLYKNTGVTIS